MNPAARRLSIALVLSTSALLSRPPSQTVAYPYYLKQWFPNQQRTVINAACLTHSPKGRVWLSTFGGTGHIYILDDQNGDGMVAAGEVTQWTTAAQAAAHPNASGILFVGGDLWVSSTDPAGSQVRIGVYPDTNQDLTPDGTYVLKISGPLVGQHQNNQMVLGPDGLVYLAVGSRTNDQAGGPLNATVVRFNPALANPTLQSFALGLRNCFDLCFDGAGNLFGTDNGRDDFGPLQPLEELNHIIASGDYGFPLESSTRIAPIGSLPAHCSPVGIVSYNHARFPGVAGSLLVQTYKNLFHPTPRAGRTLYRAQLTPSGSTFTATLSEFVTAPGGEWDLATALDLSVDSEGDVFILEYAAVPLAPERILKLSHPFLELRGNGAIGTNLEVRSSARAGDIQVTFFGKPLVPPVPVPPFGELAIDPTLMFFLDAASMPGNDLYTRTLAVPNDAALRGARIMFQTFVSDALQPSRGVFTAGALLQIP